MLVSIAFVREYRDSDCHLCFDINYTALVESEFKIINGRKIDISYLYETDFLFLTGSRSSPGAFWNNL